MFMKRMILVLEVLLMAIIASVVFSLFALIWLNTIFWLKIAGTLVLSYKVFDFILTLVETYIDRKKITKTTDDIMKAFDAFKTPPTTPIEDSSPIKYMSVSDVIKEYDLHLTEEDKATIKELYKEDVKAEPTLWDLAPSIISMYIDTKNRLNAIDDKDCSEKQLKKKRSVLKQNEKNLDNFLKNLEKELSEEEHIEGMSPIARHKYEKELKAKAKRPSAKVKSTKK